MLPSTALQHGYRAPSPQRVPETAQEQPITLTELLSVVGAAALASLPTQSSSVEVCAYDEQTGEVKRFYINDLALQGLGCQGADLKTPAGYAQLVKIVTTHRRFCKMGFSRNDIETALASAPFPPALHPVCVKCLSQAGFPDDTLDQVQAAGVLNGFTRLYLIDFCNTFQKEIDYLRVQRGLLQEEINLCIIKQEFYTTIREAIPEEVSARSELQHKMLQEMYKSYLRSLSYDRRQISVMQSAGTLTSTVEQHILAERAARQREIEFVKQFGYSDSSIDSLICGHAFDDIHRILDKHQLDIRYLRKKGLLLNEIHTALVAEDYQTHLSNLFEDEFMLLGAEKPAVNAFMEGKLSLFFKEWLKTHTAYSDIVSRTIKNPQRRRLLRAGRLSLNLRKRTLQQLFLNAILALRESKRSTKVIPPPKGSLLPGAFIIDGEGENPVYQLLHYAGHIKKKMESAPGVLGVGSFGAVQEIALLSTGDVFALKSALQHADPIRSHSFRSSVLEEYELLQKLGKDPIIASAVPIPFKFIYDDSLIGFITQRFDGDLFHFYEHLEAWPIKVVELYRGLQGILKVMQRLHELKIAHRDIKIENILFNYHQPTKELTLALIDFGGATTYEQLAVEGYYGGKTLECFVQSDDFHQSRLICRRRPAEEFHDFFEKKEIFSFGMAMLNLLATPSTTQRSLANARLDRNLHEVYGAGITNLLKATLNIDPAKRPSIAHAIATFEEVIQDQSEDGKRALAATFSKIHHLRVVGGVPHHLVSLPQAK